MKSLRCGSLGLAILFALSASAGAQTPSELEYTSLSNRAPNGEIRILCGNIVIKQDFNQTRPNEPLIIYKHLLKNAFVTETQKRLGAFEFEHTFTPTESFWTLGRRDGDCLFAPQPAISDIKSVEERHPVYKNVVVVYSEFTSNASSYFKFAAEALGVQGTGRRRRTLYIEDPLSKKYIFKASDAGSSARWLSDRVAEMHQLISVAGPMSVP